MRIYVLLAILVLTGCRTIYVPVESVKTEYRENCLRDSIHIYDSIFVMMKNDTVWMEKYKTIYKDRFLRDSVFINDTIRVPYPVEKVVYRNKLSILQKSISLFSVLFLCLLFYRWKKA